MKKSSLLASFLFRLTQQSHVLMRGVQIMPTKK